MAKNILVIDDDQLVVKTIARYLKSCGYTVEAVTSGADAINKVEATPFSLIIADIRMPGMDGIETIKKLRLVSQDKHKTRIPEIIITGYASEEAQKEAADLGVADYIYKPFDVSTFIAAVKRNLQE